MESTSTVGGDDGSKSQPDAADTEATHVPWGYGRDRITAMVVDPVRVLVYWEVTDDGIAAARTRLPEDDREAAVLTLRLYDVTDRIFDGTNAHGHVDQPIDRRQRRWFFDVVRPESVVVLEIGLRSAAGRFVRIARSRRAEFPRRRPAASGATSWMTVTEHGRHVDAGSDAQTHVPGGMHIPAVTSRLGGASEWSFARAGA